MLSICCLMNQVALNALRRDAGLQKAFGFELRDRTGHWGFSGDIGKEAPARKRRGCHAYTPEFVASRRKNQLTA